jgi:hypothetical protein
MLSTGALNVASGVEAEGPPKPGPGVAIILSTSSPLLATEVGLYNQQRVEDEVESCCANRQECFLTKYLGMSKLERPKANMKRLLWQWRVAEVTLEETCLPRLCSVSKVFSNGKWRHFSYEKSLP